jgi:threonylcarbamoyladenosine tRNA methylthiotransferase MtaB
MQYTVAFETLGCRLNQAETAHLHRSFMDRGYVIVENSAAADLCVVNTCALTSQAASKCRRRIRSILRANPDVCIAAVGCYAQTDTEVLRAIEGLDYIIGTADKLDLARMIPEPIKLPEPIIVTRRLPRDGFSVPGTGYYPSHTRANVKIQEGCDFVCSFCIIPKSRGPARSRDFDDILRETRSLVAEGHREIILTGINLGTYRHGARGLVELIEAQSRIEGLERIRLSSIEPTTIDTRLFTYMNGRMPAVASGSGSGASSRGGATPAGPGSGGGDRDGTVSGRLSGGALCPYLHISLQSGDDRVLEAMRRHYTARQFEEFVELFLERVPGAGLGTDVMVGFPGEDDEAFERTYELVSRIPFTHIHVFSFSARKGTAAYLMKNKVPAAVIAERSERMHALGEEKKEAYYARHIGRTVRVLFEERESSGHYVGFSDNYVKVGVERPELAAGRETTNEADPPERGAFGASINVKRGADLANRMGTVMIRECLRCGPGRSLLAVGELAGVESAGRAFADGGSVPKESADVERAWDEGARARTPKQR